MITFSCGINKLTEKAEKLKNFVKSEKFKEKFTLENLGYVAAGALVATSVLADIPLVDNFVYAVGNAGAAVVAAHYGSKAAKKMAQDVLVNKSEFAVVHGVQDENGNVNQEVAYAGDFAKPKISVLKRNLLLRKKANSL